MQYKRSIMTETYMATPDDVRLDRRDLPLALPMPSGFGPGDGVHRTVGCSPMRKAATIAAAILTMTGFSFDAAANYTGGISCQVTYYPASPGYPTTGTPQMCGRVCSDERYDVDPEETDGEAECWADGGSGLPQGTTVEYVSQQ